MTLDPLIHAPVRLSVIAALATADAIEYGFFVERLQISESLLSKHLAKLEAAGLIRSWKRRRGRRHYTWLALTPAGRRAYDDYRAQLDAILAPTAVDQRVERPADATVHPAHDRRQAHLRGRFA